MEPAKGCRAKTSGQSRGMRTASDVIHRIQWDDNLAADLFTIGYLDRFKGLVEQPFTRFSHWGDLPNADPDVDLAIPQHRIIYFKYKDTKVWDKTQKLDLVFGSTANKGSFGQQDTIEDVMQAVDQRIEAARFVHLEDSDSSESEDDDEEAEEEDGPKVVIEAAMIGPDMSSLVQDLPPDRSTHFIAIKITNKDIIEKAVAVQRHIAGEEVGLSECCLASGLFHLTICMLRIDQPEEEAKLARFFTDSIVPDVKALMMEHSHKNQGLRIRGLGTFGQRVLYAKAEPEGDAPFWPIVSAVMDRVNGAEPGLTVSNKFDLTPHMTLVKVNRSVARNRRSKYLPSRLYEEYLDLDFGLQPLDNLQLCVIEANTASDGFYTTLSKVEIQQPD